MQTVVAERQRDYLGPLTNTDIWHDFRLRADDVIVTTPPKCGTTWMLNIVMMLIHGRVVPDAGNSKEAPWLDCGFRDRQEIAVFLNSLERRRCIKSHTPMDGILYGSEPTYIVVYRHPVDAHFSLRRHASNMDNDWIDHLFPDDEREGFHRFIDAQLTDAGTDNFSVASIAHHFLRAKAHADRGNVHFFHYADLTRDLPGQIMRLAGLLDIALSEVLRDEIAQATTFKAMRKAVETSERRFHKDTPFRDLADFFESGSSNKWQGRLSDADMAAYAKRIGELLPADDVAWLEWGERRAEA